MVKERVEEIESINTMQLRVVEKSGGKRHFRAANEPDLNPGVSKPISARPMTPASFISSTHNTLAKSLVLELSQSGEI